MKTGLTTEARGHGERLFPLCVSVPLWLILLAAGCAKPDPRIAQDDAAVVELAQEVAHLNAEIATLQSLTSLQVDQITNINARIRLAEDMSNDIRNDLAQTQLRVDQIERMTNSWYRRH